VNPLVIVALWVLDIWNPDKMDFIPDPKRRRQKRLYYRVRGLVEHDRVLNGERMWI
jgi:hypothetical protein